MAWLTEADLKNWSGDIDELHQIAKAREMRLSDDVSKVLRDAGVEEAEAQAEILLRRVAEFFS